MNSPPVNLAHPPNQNTVAVCCAPTVSTLPAEPAEPTSSIEYRSGLTKSEAEFWLDWLEANGCQGCELTYRTDRGFTVWKHKAHQ